MAHQGSVVAADGGRGVIQGGQQVFLDVADIGGVFPHPALAQEGWCSVHTVLDEKCFWEIIGKLKSLGAEGILVLPIEKMIL